MGLFDDLSSEGVAPENGMPNLRVVSEEVSESWEDDTEPVEHYDIRSTPVSMPDAPKGSSRKTKLQRDLESFYTIVGTGIFPFDQQVGVTILDSAPKCAESLTELAQKNPRLKRTLESMMNAGTYGAVISAHLPIAVIIATKYIPPIRDNYGRIMDEFKAKQDK